jgi:hypothetical protein
MNIHDNEDIGEDPGPDSEVEEEESCEVCGSPTCAGCCDCGDCPQCESRALSEFADPGGNSALRAATPSNPRNLPCPSCGEPDRLTPADRALGYQCDECANAAEGWGP